MRPAYQLSSNASEIRRFQVAHALRSVEDALTLLSRPLVEGVELTALERVRDDLAIVLRRAVAECSR
jgi:hypothetical protein